MGASGREGGGAVNQTDRPAATAATPRFSERGRSGSNKSPADGSRASSQPLAASLLPSASDATSITQAPAKSQIREQSSHEIVRAGEPPAWGFC
jgi:hypothetical protein